ERLRRRAGYPILLPHDHRSGPAAGGATAGRLRGAGRRSGATGRIGGPIVRTEARRPLRRWRGRRAPGRTSPFLGAVFMSTDRSTGRGRERQAARLFGSERQPGSGSGGRSDQSRSDSTHDRLFIETKLRASSAVRTLWERTAALARREAKTPVLML